MEAALSEYRECRTSNQTLKEKLAKGVAMEAALYRLIMAMGGGAEVEKILTPESIPVPMPKAISSGNMTDLVKEIIRDERNLFTISDIMRKVKEAGRDIDRPTANIILWKMVKNELIDLVQRGRRGSEGIYQNKIL